MKEGFRSRLMRSLFTADAIGVVLVLTAMLAFTRGIASSLPSTDTRYLFRVCLGAAVIAFGLGKSRVNGKQASAWIAALGFAGVWILGAGLASPLMSLGRGVLSLIPQIVPAIRSHTALDTSLIAGSWNIIIHSSAALMQRLSAWMFSGTRAALNDALIRSLVWLLTMWLTSAWAGWFTSKRRAVPALLPWLFVLAGVLSYSERNVETLWVVAMMLLLLMGVWGYKNHTLQWEQRKMDYSESVLIDATSAVVLLSIVIGAAAFFAPSVSWREVRDYLQRFNSEDKTAERLGIQRPSAGTVRTPDPAMPREHWLHSENVLSPEIVMTIRTGELPPGTSPAITISAPRYYWRSAIYDVYAGAGWLTSTSTLQKVPADVPLLPGLLSGYKPVRMDVRIQQPEGHLFWSGILYSADVPLTADWRLKPQPSLFADPSTFLLADMFSALSDADSYHAETYVPNPSVDDLRNAGAKYPQMIRDHYLSLPSTVPVRVRDLARQITAEETNPYEKAKAIERYLRANYPYDLNVPDAAPGQDVTDYFLFELKRGYCDYYATAMVVLSRASGLPARFVSGYSPGTYDAPNARYIVRALNAHSWAEVYFPGIGWVEFEPTASEPEIERWAASLPLPPPEPQTLAWTDWIRRLSLEGSFVVIAPMIGILFFLLIYLLFIERWLYLRLSPSLAVERIHNRLYKAGRPFAGEWTRAETAHEFAERLSARMEQVRARLGFDALLSRIQTDATALTDLYQTSLFVDVHTHKKDARDAWRLWNSLRFRLVLARLLLHYSNRRRTVTLMTDLNFMDRDHTDASQP